MNDHTSQPVAGVEIKCVPDSLKLVPIDSIIPNPKNNNRHSVEQLEALKKIVVGNGGFRNPLTVSNRSGHLIAGHARLEIAKDLGMKMVPVIFQDFKSEAEEYQHMTADNEIARWSELDLHEVFTSIKEIKEIDPDMLGVNNLIFEPEDKGFNPSPVVNEKPHKVCPNCGAIEDKKHG